MDGTMFHTNRSGRLFFALLTIIGTLMFGFCAQNASAQVNPVYVNDSPQAWEMFQRAEEQQDGNVGESVRLFQDLLNEYPLRLIPAFSTAIDHYRSVRDRVNDVIAQDATLLARYQLIATPEAQRLLQAGELERLAVSRALTEPGLEAMLRLAQHDLESAHFASAIQWLDEAIAHPSIDDVRAAHAWYMLGSAAAYSRNERRLQEARDALEFLGPIAQRHRDRLNAIPALMQLPDRIGVTIDMRADAGDISDLVSQPIWSQPLDQSLLRRRMFSTGSDTDQLTRLMTERRRRGQMATIVPTVQDSVAYVSEGHRITAVDRFTGRMLWRRAMPTALSISDRDSNPVYDMNVIAVANDTLIVIAGHAQDDQRSQDGRIICLDAGTGEIRWLRDLDRMGGSEEYEGLFAYGSPLIVDGSVFVLARKLSRQNLTSVYLVCLDGRHGSLNWAQYLVSSGTVRRTPGRPFSTPSYRDGQVLVSSPVGAIAAINARTGNINWLRRYPVPMAVPLQDIERRPWEIKTAVWTPLGVIAIQPDHARVIVLDNETGDELESYPATANDAWGGPRDLLANDHSVFAIGREIRAFRFEDLQRPIWQLPTPRIVTMNEMGEELVTGGEQIAVSGRVQMTGEYLVVPAQQGVLMVDNETGRVRTTVEVDGLSGNPLVDDSQLLLADSDALHMFMSFTRAEQMLRSRLASQPADPEPALALVQLGRRVGRLDLILEGGELVLDRLQQIDQRMTVDVRAMLFGLLLATDLQDLDRLHNNQQRPGEPPSQSGQALFDLMGRVAATHAQQVEHRFSWASWLSRRDLATAIEVYQSVLTDPQLAEMTRLEDERIFTAADWVRQRLGQLLEVHGATAYQPFATRAAEQFHALVARDDVDPERLLEVARHYPFASAALDAVVRAADLEVERGRPVEASAILLAGYRALPSDTAATHLLGRYVRLCEQLGRPIAAHEALSYVAGRYANIRLHTGDGLLRLAETWREEIERALPPRHRVSIGKVSGLADTSAGVLVDRIDRWGEGSREYAASADAFLLAHEGVVVCVDGSTLEQRWTTRAIPGVPQMLRHTRRAMILWSTSDPDDPKAFGLDPATGEVRWTTPRLSDLVGDVVGDLDRGRAVREQLAGGQPFDPRQVLPILTGDRLVLVRRTGGVVGFHSADAAEPMWARHSALAQVHHAVMDEHILVLAGLAGQGAGRQTAVIMGIDPDTGETLWQRPSLEGDVLRWMVPASLGRIICANRHGLESIDSLTGRSQWVNIGYAVAEALRGWPVGPGLIINSPSALYSVAVDTGHVSEPFEGPVRGDWNQFSVQVVIPIAGQDRALVRYERRIVAFTSAGQVIGADVVNEDREYRWLVPAGDRIVVISGRAEQSIVPDEAGRRTQYFYRIYLMSENGMLLDRPHDLPPLRRQIFQVHVVNGRLLMSTADQTLMIPMPSSAR